MNNIKGGNNMLDELILDLKQSKKIQLSKNPNLPGDDEKINHEYVNHRVFITNTGSVLLLDLRNISSGEITTYSYCDIESVTLNDHSNETFQKYYITCLNRTNKLYFDDLDGKKKRGYNLNEYETNMYYKGYNDVYRILINR